MHTRGGTILFKYTPKEIHKLQKMGKLTEKCSSHLDDNSVLFVESEATKGGESIFYEWDLPSSSDSDDD